MKTHITPGVHQSLTLTLGVVVGFSADGACCVAVAESENPLECDLLQTSERYPLCLVEGDSVILYLLPDRRGVIAGRVGPSAAAKIESTPDHLVLDANKSVTLQCGEGSITLRGDGKVLIQGKDIVSRAEVTNRVQGAAVAFN